MLTASLIVEPPEGAPFRVRLDRSRHRIGRANDNDIAVPDRALSRYHAVVLSEGDRHVLGDCGSQNGTRLNDVLIEAKQTLREGDIIHLGRTRLTYRTGLSSTSVVLKDREPGAPEISPNQTIEGTLTARDLLTSTRGAASGTTAAGDETLLRELRYLAVFNRVGLELVAHRPPEELFDIVLQLLLDAVGAERGILLLLEGEPRRLEPKLSKTREDVPVEDVEITVSRSVLDRVVSSRQAMLSGAVQREFGTMIGLNLAERSVMAAPLWNGREVLGAIYVDSRAMMKEFNREDLRVLTALANMVAVKLENSRLTELSMEKLRLDRELALAAEIQERLLPAAPPQVAGWEIEAFQVPCRTVGGDLYDLIVRPGELDATIGDVAGKGMAAAMLMSHVQAVMRTSIELGAAPSAMIEQLNRSVCARSTQGRFVTFFFARIAPATGRIDYINAGHNNPIVIGPNGALTSLQTGGPVLGVAPEVRYPVGSHELARGETLFLYTDGLTDVKNAAGKRLGEPALRDLLARLGGRPAAQGKKAILASQEAFAEGVHAPDDVTFLMIRRL